MSDAQDMSRQETARDELPEGRFHTHGVLDPQSRAREYRIAAGEAAATNVDQPWNVVAALAHDAGNAVANCIQTLENRDYEAAGLKDRAGGSLGRDVLWRRSHDGRLPQELGVRSSSSGRSLVSRAASVRPGSGDQGRAGLVHLGEHECSEWVLQQRMNRARSLMLPRQQRNTPGLPPTGFGGNMQRQSSVLDETLDGSQAKAAKTFSDFIKQEAVKLESGTVTKPRYPEIDEEEESEGVGTDSTGDGGAGMGDGADGPPIRPRKSRHYDAKDDVILRMEALQAKEVKVIVIILWIFTALAAAFLIIDFVLKFVWAVAPFDHDKHVPITNLVVGFVCLGCLTFSLGRMSIRLVRCQKLHKRWAARRYSHAMLAYAELIIGFVNNVNFVIPNIYLIAVPCSWEAPIIAWCSFIRWTCYNCVFLLFWVHAHNAIPWHHEFAGSKVLRFFQQQEWKQAPEDAIVLDAGFLYHWPKYVYWLCFEGLLIAVIVNYEYGENTQKAPTLRPGQDPSANCDSKLWHCDVSHAQIALVAALVALAYLYFIMYFVYMKRATSRLGHESYAKYKMGCILIRLHSRLRTNIIIFFMVSIAVLYFVKHNTCRSYIEIWGGLLPVQIVMTAVVCCWAHLMMPTDPRKTSPVLGVWLQEFAWTEEDKAQDLQTRDSGNNRLSSKDAERLHKQPMFCMETAINMFYWSVLVYDHEEALESKVLLDTAMSLYGLEHSEMYWEKAQDTKMLISWNKDTIVIAFRGTSSMANALADLQAWQTIHPPKRGRGLRHPKVHIGFYKSWVANELDVKVKERVLEIIKDHKGTTKLYVTGHSLGGALATLAAYDLKGIAAKHSLDLQVSCYTFGAPRVGNHAFAEDFDSIINDCFHIVNHQDIVPKSPKFLVLYKRAGYRVIINQTGDMIVRPSAIEASVQVAGHSVAHHLMGSYQRSLLAVLLAQFTRKRFAGGMAGVVRLAMRSVTAQELLMEEAGLDVAALRRLSKWGDMAPHIGAKIAPSLDVRQNRTLLKIPSIPSKLMRSLSSSSRQVAAKSTGTGSFGRRMLSWTQRPAGALGRLGSVKETSQDEETGLGTGSGTGSPPADRRGSGSGALPADAAAMGPMPLVKAPHVGDARTLQERCTDHAGKPPATDVAQEKPAECGHAQLHAESEEQEHLTLADVAKHAPTKSSSSGFSPFAALSGNALDTADEDTLEIDRVDERDAAAGNDNTAQP